MALINFTTPFGGILPAQSWTTISPLQRHATAINNMLYGPAGHQQQNDQEPDYDYDYKNEPYAPPAINRQHQPQTLYQPSTLSQQQPQQYRRPNDYLPPATPRNSQPRRPAQQQQQQQPQQKNLNNINSPDRSSLYTTRSFGSSLEPQRKVVLPQQKPLQPPLKQPQYNDRFNDNDYNVRRVTSYPQSQGTSSIDLPNDYITTQSTVAPPTQNIHSQNHLQRGGSITSTGPNRQHDGSQEDNDDRTTSSMHNGGFPSQAATYTRVQAGTGSNTNVHAILDYDDDGDDYYDERDDGEKGG